MTFKLHDTVRSKVELQIPGLATVCTPGCVFTVTQVKDDTAIVISRTGPSGNVAVNAADIEPAYQVVNGISYSTRTPDSVIKVLEGARTSGERLRLRLGDRITGRDWLEEHDVEGRIGNSMGPTKVPLLIRNRRSLGGPALLDDAIVAITTTGENGRNLHRHPTYHTGKIELVRPTGSDFDVAITVDGRLHAQFKTSKQATQWMTRFGN
jgi:hypothetical protein